jgi:hypothetical protein
VLWSTPERARLVVPRFDRRSRTDLGRWAILDLGKSTYGIARSGPLRGLVTTPVPRDALDIVRERATRDSIHPRARRAMTLDCRACGACCRHNDVVLTKSEARRIRLRVLPNGRCSELGAHNTCRIYDERPRACRDFPPASECCLFSREDELGVVDGLVISSSSARRPAARRR